MKKKNLNKKLSLNKMTVTNLTDQQQATVHGGSGSCAESCMYGCPSAGCADIPPTDATI